jgi:hypothetical protein
MKTKYQVIHKLTQKPIRNYKTADIIFFDDKSEAQKVVDMKNKIMGAPFYEVKEVV